jgi:hypothetical protein
MLAVRRQIGWVFTGVVLLAAAGRAEKPDFVFDTVPFEHWGAALADAQYPERDARLFRYVLDVPGGYVNDHCLVHADGEWHLFCIQGEVAPAGQTWMRPGNEVKIGHATDS